MGTAGIQAETVAKIGNWSAEGKGSVSKDTADAASACHSFLEEVGRGAGAKGARLSAGLMQQTGVGHFAQPDLQHLQPVCDAVGPLPADTVETPCHTRRNPSRVTSAVFTSRVVMASSWSF